ncbi:MAG: hypothetical protein WA144_08985 [Candidatus Methanoperedens sp.]
MSTQENYFIVNTNRRYRPDVYREMLREKKAATYYDRKEKISNIHEGNTVFLYHNRVGVIACGKATADFKIKDFRGIPMKNITFPLNLTGK